MRRLHRILVVAVLLSIAAGLYALRLPECDAAEVPRHCVEN